MFCRLVWLQRDGLIPAGVVYFSTEIWLVFQPLNTEDKGYSPPATAERDNNISSAKSLPCSHAAL
jgi:hypothetical protein